MAFLNGSWDHNEMQADIECGLDYSVVTRSGSIFTVDLSCFVSLSSYTEESRYGYAISATVSIGGQSGTVQLLNNYTYDNTPLRGGNPAISGSLGRFSFDVGTSSGAIAVSVTFNGGCGCGKGSYTLSSDSSNAIPYAVTNTAPTAPTSISPSSGVFNNVIPVSWSGSNDSEGDTLHYCLQVSKNNGSFQTIAGSTIYTGTSYSYDISGDANGTTYLFRVYAMDTSEAGSSWYTATGTVSKNRSPIATTSVSTAESFAKDKTTVNWLVASDPDGQVIRYKVNIYKNSVYLTNVIVSTLYYEYTFPLDTPTNTVFTFGVVTLDIFDYTSSETKGGNCIKKLAPINPSLVYPLSTAVYDTKPRILVKINEDLNGDNQKIYITWRGIEYNNVDNPTWFSNIAFTLVNGNTLVIKPQINAVIGNSTIRIRTNNGYFFSDYVDRVILTIDIGSLNISAGTTITPSYISAIRANVSTVLQTYGLLALPVKNIISPNKIMLADIDEIKTALTNLINTLNIYDSLNTKFDKPITWEISDIIVNGNYIQEIKTKLLDL